MPATGRVRAPVATRARRGARTWLSNDASRTARGNKGVDTGARERMWRGSADVRGTFRRQASSRGRLTTNAGLERRQEPALRVPGITAVRVLVMVLVRARETTRGQVHRVQHRPVNAHAGIGEVLDREHDLAHRVLASTECDQVHSSVPADERAV